jgi:hypothetical protein
MSNMSPIPLSESGQLTGRFYLNRSAGRGSKDRPGVPLLRSTADCRRVEASRLGGEPQAGPSHYARGQFIVPAAAPVCGNHQLPSSAPGLIPISRRTWNSPPSTNCWWPISLISRLETEFVYLAVILDAFSRRVVSGALDWTLEALLITTALRGALQERRLSPGLGASFRRGMYSTPAVTIPDLLKEHRIMIITISMSHDQHEMQRNPLRQRGLRIVYEDAGLPARIPWHGGGAGLHRRSSIVLTTRSDSSRCSATGRRRSSNGLKPMLRKTRGPPRMRFLRHSGIYWSDVSFQPVTPARVPPPVGRPRKQGIGRDRSTRPAHRPG